MTLSPAVELRIDTTMPGSPMACVRGNVPDRRDAERQWWSDNARREAVST